MWEPEPPDPIEFQVGPQSQGPGEAQVARGFTKYTWGPGDDQSVDPGADQLTPDPPGPSEAQGVTRVTR